MKKTLIAFLSVAALFGCAKETVISTQKEAITFDNAFVDNATKAAYDGSYNSDNLQQFEVYATITGEEGHTANIFKQELVKKGNELGQGANWSYAVANTQYWIPGNTYTFRAIADGNVANVTEVVALEADKYLASAINLLDASAQKDILFAEEKVVYTSGAKTVKFTFEHILAKAKFTVKNTIVTNNGYSYKVSDLSVNGIAKNGVYTIADKTWAAGNETYDLAFGNGVADGTAAGLVAENIAYGSQVESNFDRLLIPTSAEALNITFTYELLKDGIVIDTQDKTIETPALTLKSGQAYNFVISLGNPGEPIQFDVEKVTDWEERAPIVMDPIEVATPAALVAAVANGENVVLTQDINLDLCTRAAIAEAQYEGLVIDKDVVIDGAGHKLTSQAVRAINIKGGVNVVLKNFVLEATMDPTRNYGDNGQRAINIMGANNTVVIEDVVASTPYYVVNTTGSAAEANVTIKSSTLTGIIPVNVWGKNSNVYVSDSKLTVVDNSSDEGYAAIKVNNGADASVVTVLRGEVEITGTDINNSKAGAIAANEGAAITFDGTKGRTDVEGLAFVINYGNMSYSFSTFAGALAKANDGETIVLTKNVTIQSHLTINKNITLDLNGKTLSVDLEGSANGDDAIWVRDNAEVVITGNGTIQIVNSLPEMTYGSGIFATGTSKLTIENTTVIAAGEAVFAQSSAQVIINGGSFKSTDTPQFTLNLKGGSNAVITVNAGRFYNFNPADNTAENPAVNFVAAGKSVTADGDWYVVE